MDRRIFFCFSIDIVFYFSSKLKRRVHAISLLGESNINEANGHNGNTETNKPLTSKTLAVPDNQHPIGQPVNKVFNLEPLKSFYFQYINFVPQTKITSASFNRDPPLVIHQMVDEVAADMNTIDREEGENVQNSVYQIEQRGSLSVVSLSELEIGAEYEIDYEQ